MSTWLPCPYAADYRFDIGHVRALWPALHAVDAEPLPEADALLQAWARRTLEPDDPQARQYREQLQRFQCELIAELHNRTDASQRREAATRLQGWARDLRAAGAATATAAGS